MWVPVILEWVFLHEHKTSQSAYVHNWPLDFTEWSSDSITEGQWPSDLNAVKNTGSENKCTVLSTLESLIKNHLMKETPIFLRSFFLNFATNEGQSLI